MGVSLKFLSCVDNACGDRKRRRSSFRPPLLDLGILLGLSLVTGCKPDVFRSEGTHKSQAPSEQDAAQILRETDKFNSEVEASKALAIKEFPDLRIAGSPLNKVFLEEVAFLRQWMSPELKNSNWPYLTAQKAFAKIARAEQETKMLEEKKRLHGITASELKAMPQLPATKIKISDEVKAFEISLADRLVAKVYLNPSVYFELDWNSRRFSTEAKPTLEIKKDKMLLVYKSLKGITIDEIVVLKIGQDVSVVGKCQKVPGGKILIGHVESVNGVLNWSN